ncbi:MarR family winged helix-turn-helix transcriptional regulator [Kibdelosporangium phytohabitans]|uniref:MarR family transcriptional regulator n=1 Tax=Kibdelosporangium phytohabitans TaxID=860235 RepID=A0A0N9I349_9PSEU|nr:MarR family transcriptional regulator [Kibdelosporangium phytohabitans]ALG10300.1 MarR family transcriptional regulator [Kibdelosporangium phytohabitans]MBE1461332.1 DNA-binding MarR family transcriptional regulator [Kibdelosporangium phytohabitans]
MTDDRWLTESELAAWKDFLTVTATIHRRIEQQLKDEAGLTHPQYEVLTRLSDTPEGSLRMTELAQAAVTSKSGLTYQVTQLEKAGLVGRRTSTHDERGVVAYLTDKGWAKIRDTAPGHAALVRALFRDGLSEREFTGMATAIAALHDHLR